MNCESFGGHNWEVSAADIPGYYFCTHCRADGFYNQSAGKIEVAA